MTRSEHTIDECVALFRSSDGTARERARRELVEIGTAAIPALSVALSDRSHQVRWEAAKTLQEMERRPAAPLLVQALADREFDVRWIAAEGLIALGHHAAVPLLQALVHEKPSVLLIQGAHHVVGDLMARNEEPALEPVWRALTGVEPSVAVPEAAAEALEEIRARR